MIKTSDKIKYKHINYKYRIVIFAGISYISTTEAGELRRRTERLQSRFSGGCCRFPYGQHIVFVTLTVGPDKEFPLLSLNNINL